MNKTLKAICLILISCSVLLTSHTYAKDSLNIKEGDNSYEIIPPSFIGKNLHNPIPNYPYISKENHEEGTVHLSAMVETNGRPSSVAVLQSSGYLRLDQSAQDTVMNQYHFAPATKNGLPIRFRCHIKFVFKLTPHNKQKEIP